MADAFGGTIPYNCCMGEAGDSGGPCWRVLRPRCAEGRQGVGFLREQQRIQEVT